MAKCTDINPSDYFICLIDIMGQKEFFKSITSLKVEKQVQEDIIRVSSGLKEIIRYIRNRYDKHFTKEDDVGVELFSDTILLSLKERAGDKCKLTVWLDIIIKTVFIACRYKLPFRGSLVRGLAQRSRSGTIYGVAVDDAIQLEQSRADYFRIVLSNKLASDLTQCEDLDAEKYFEIDVDSAMVLNYAGPRILWTNEFVKERQQFRTILQWINERIEYFCYNGIDEHDRNANPKLVRRFKLWGEYLMLEYAKKDIEANVRNS